MVKRRLKLNAVILKKAIVVVSVLMLSSASLVIAVSPAQAAGSPRKILTGWIPYYGMKTALPSAIANGDLIKEVMPFWYTLKSEKLITDLYSPANPSVPMAIPLASMHDSGFTIIPTITDGTDKMVLANLIANPTTRTQTVATITNLVMTNNFDGIDLDFEGFAFVDANTTWTTTQPNWVAFVQELSTALHSRNKLLSITTPVLFDPTSGKKGYYLYDWASISPMIDRLRIMTYDFSTTTPGPIGPITWAEQSLQYAVKVVAASKVYLGVAGYGRDWVTKVVGICPEQYIKAISPTAKAATFVMRDATSLITSYGAQPLYVDANAEVTFSYDKVYSGLNSSGLATSCTASRVAWYQDSRSYAARAALVAKYHIGGITAWTLGMEDTTATDALRQVAQSIAPDQVVSTLSVEPVVDQNGIAFGTPVTVKGELRLTDKTPVAGLAVRLESKAPGETTWRELLKTATDASGVLSAQLLVGSTSSLRISTQGTWDKSASQSPEVNISLNRRISITAPTSVSAGSKFSITGIVQPHQAGVGVSLERFSKGGWVTTGQPFVTDQSGGFNIEGIEKSRGLLRLRVSVVSDSKFSAIKSPIFSIVVR